MQEHLEWWLSTIDHESVLDSADNPFMTEKGSVESDAVLIRMVSMDPVGFVFTKRIESFIGLEQGTRELTLIDDPQ
jgi:hypothetical protein